MTTVERLRIRNLIFAGIAALLVLFIVLRAPETSAVQEGEMPKLFPDLKLEDIRSVSLRRTPKADAETPPSGPQKLEIALKGDAGWVVESAHGYPASTDKVVALVESLQGARIGRVVTQKAGTFDEYAAPEGWVEVVVKGSSGNSLASFGMGKSARWPDSYVRIDQGGKPHIVRAGNLDSGKVRLALDAWTEARLWPDASLPSVTRIEVEQSEEGRTLAFVRHEEKVEGEGDGKPATTKTVWKMVEPEEAVAETYKVEGLIRSLTGMRLKDVVAGPAGPESGIADAGLDAPRYRIRAVGTAVAEGIPVPEYELEIGQPVAAAEGEEPDAAYVRRVLDGWMFTVSKFSVADFEKAPQEFLPTPPEDEAEGEPAAPGGNEASGDPDADAPGEPLPEMPPLPPEPESEAPIKEPDAPTVPDAPKEPDAPKAPDAPKEPDAPKAPDAPKEPDEPTK